MERVSTRRGNEPFLVIAPHGANDTHTDIIAETISNQLDAYAVINRGWERSRFFDYYQDKANCNYIPHCHQDVVKEEFLDPILDFVSEIEREYTNVLVLNIHGVGNDIVKLNKGNQVDFIIGYGEGKPSRYSCDLSVKDTLCYLFARRNYAVCKGVSGGKYSAWSKDNLNQLFNKWYPNPIVNSLQIEIVYELRCQEELAKVTGMEIADVVNILLYTNFQKPKPDDWNKILQRVGEI